MFSVSLSLTITKKYSACEMCKHFLCKQSNRKTCVGMACVVENNQKKIGEKWVKWVKRSKKSKDLGNRRKHAKIGKSTEKRDKSIKKDKYRQKHEKRDKSTEKTGKNTNFNSEENWNARKTGLNALCAWCQGTLAKQTKC